MSSSRVCCRVAPGVLLSGPWVWSRSGSRVCSWVAPGCALGWLLGVLSSGSRVCCRVAPGCALERLPGVLSGGSWVWCRVGSWVWCRVGSWVCCRVAAGCGVPYCARVSKQSKRRWSVNLCRPSVVRSLVGRPMLSEAPVPHTGVWTRNLPNQHLLVGTGACSSSLRAAGRASRAPHRLCVYEGGPMGGSDTMKGAAPRTNTRPACSSTRQCLQGLEYVTGFGGGLCVGYCVGWRAYSKRGRRET